MSTLDPDVEAHVARWAEFKALATDFERQFAGRSDWAIVLRFYAALHLADAHLKTGTEYYSPQQHADRDAAIYAPGGLPKAARDAYFRLKGLRRDVRYVPTFRARPQDEAQARSDLAAVVVALRPALKARGYDVP